MATDREIIEHEQQLIKEALEHPGVRLLFQKLNALVEVQKTKQLECDPYTETGAAAIKRAQEFRFVVTELFPQIMESLVNYDAEAPDKQVQPKRRWSIFNWLNPSGRK